MSPCSATQPHLTILCRSQDYRTWHADGNQNGCRNRKKCTPAGATLQYPGNRTKVGDHMKLAAYISIALAMSGLPSAPATPAQCRFIEARPEREACYQRQETARAVRQKANETQQAAQPTPYEPMTPEDAQM